MPDVSSGHAARTLADALRGSATLLSMQGVLFGAWLPGPLKPPSAHPQDPSTVKGLTSHDWIRSTLRDPPPSASSRYLPWSPPDQQGRPPLLWDPHPSYHLGRHILAPCTSTMPPSTGSAHSMGLLSHWIRPPLFHGIHSHSVLLGATSHDLASAHVRLLRHHPLDPPTTWDLYPIGSAHLLALHIQ